MAERRLNFNASLLSTRRMHNTAVSVRRNKSNNFTHDTSSVPVLVPDQVTEAASVPFTWEQSPGTSKGHGSRPQELCDQVFTPCLPPGKVMDILNNDHMEKTIDVNQSSKVEEEEEEEEEDVFSDARDTLTGVSGYGVVETKKKTLNLSEDDPLSRDFMLNRFLPAAKAMTVEQPHYGSNRKPSTFMPEPTIQVRHSVLVPEEKRRTPNRYGESTLLPYYDHHQDIDAEESEEEDDDDVGEYAYLSRRGCGMLPHLCFKESLARQKSPSHDQVKSSKVSRFQSLMKLALDSVSKHKLGGKVLSPVHPNLTSDASSRSLSPYRHPRCMSPFRNGSPCFHDTRERTESLRANRLNKHISKVSMSQEKTVYVDTETSLEANDQQNSDVMIFPEKKPDTNLEVEELGKIKNGPVRSPLAPPSPKKPSESWLLHNLPSVVTSQTPSRRYTFHPKKQSFNEKSKWETIVKTSHMHRDHIRYSEEMVAHTSLQ